MTPSYEAIWKSFAIIPKFGGVLSIIGSVFLVRDIGMQIRAKGVQLVPFTSFILMIIGVAHIPSLFIVPFMSTWMVPPMEAGEYYGYTPAPFATGTIGTCTLQGFVDFMAVYGFASHYTLLSIFYYLIVARGWTERRLKSLSLRFFCLFFPVVIALAGALPPLFTQMYNYNGIYHCGVAPYPLNCGENSEVECMRGNVSEVYIHMAGGYLLITFVIITTTMVLISISVWRQEKKIDAYLSAGERRKRKYTKQTCHQGLRYVGAYAAAYFPVTLAHTLHHFGHGSNSEIAMFYFDAIFVPLVPFFVSVNYFRLRYTRIRETNTEKARIECLYEVLKIQNYVGCIGALKRNSNHQETQQSHNTRQSNHDAEDSDNSELDFDTIT